MDMNQMGNEFKNDLGELRKMDKGSFFSFDKLYFPTIARYLFIILCIFVAVGAIIGVLAGFAALFTTGFLSGLGVIIGSLIYGVVVIFFLRIWFEFVLVMFNINDAVQDIRKNCGK